MSATVDALDRHSRMDLEAVPSQLVGDRQAERPVDDGQHGLGAPEQRHAQPAVGQRIRHLEADVAAPHDRHIA